MTDLDSARHFAHRSNKDGTIDSICPICFATVATARNEAALKMAEIKHVCDPDKVHQYRRSPHAD
jgi:hypothetical protein